MNVGSDGSPEVPSGPHCRQVLAAGATGVTALVLPSSLAAASPGLDLSSEGLAAPSSVTAVPIGHIGSSTGAIRVTWTSVAFATGYDVGWATTSTGPYTFETAGDTVSHDLTARVGTDTTHHIVVRATGSGNPSLNSDEATSSPVIATGGTITTYVAGSITFVVHTFDTVGTTSFTTNRSLNVENLVVAGGGGGGNGYGWGPGGGGGAGGLLQGTNSLAATTTNVIVGAGGAGGTATSAPTSGATGGASSLGDLTASGGGAGGGSRTAGGNGGSGGGAGGRELGDDRAGGSGQAGQGNAGGANNGFVTSGSVAKGGGGGGGATSAGASSDTAAPGSAGAGLSSDISGSGATYAPGGTGGAGNAQANGTDASAFGGGGAGASSNGEAAWAGGAGRSGIVIVRYPLPA